MPYNGLCIMDAGRDSSQAINEFNTSFAQAVVVFCAFTVACLVCFFPPGGNPEQIISGPRPGFLAGSGAPGTTPLAARGFEIHYLRHAMADRNAGGNLETSGSAVLSMKPDDPALFVQRGGAGFFLDADGRLQADDFIVFYDESPEQWNAAGALGAALEKMISFNYGGPEERETALEPGQQAAGPKSKHPVIPARKSPAHAAVVRESSAFVMPDANPATTWSGMSCGGDGVDPAADGAFPSNEGEACKPAHQAIDDLLPAPLFESNRPQPGSRMVLFVNQPALHEILTTKDLPALAANTPASN